MKEIVLGFVTSFFVVLLTTPSLIKVAKMKKLVDDPNEERKKHRKSTPTIGGIIIFAASIFAYSLWFPSDNLNYFGSLHHFSESVSDFKFLIAATILLFFIGVKDDIIGVAPMKKLIGHVIVGFILVVMADIRIMGMHGVFGIYEIPEWASVGLSVFTYIVIVNAINLIDGSDGLAAGTGFICSVYFGLWFYGTYQYDFSMMAFVLAGSLGGFLLFNFSPAKIFMGDSGSLFIGAFVFVMAMKCIETDTRLLDGWTENVSSAVFALSVLAYPLVDTLRVFTLRILKGRSPFSPDRNHIHHQLIDSGYGHVFTALYLYLVVIAVPLVSLGFKGYSPTVAFFSMMLISFALVHTVFLFRFWKSKQKVSEATEA
ncbi:MraY family glycosyltransferase [Cryomorphaceae bacterium 1068]|nr:MraY family glycosyltransferase [Cryomorphaceae bacterium 1068]